MTRSQRKTSLTKQILLPSLTALVVFALVMGWSLIAINNATFKTKFDEIGNSLVNNIAPTLAFYLETGDREYLRARLAATFQQPEVRHIEVTHAEGHFSLALTRDDNDQIVDVVTDIENAATLPFKPSYKSFVTDIVAEAIEVADFDDLPPAATRPIGTLRAVLDRTPIINERNEAIRFGIIVALITLALMAALVTLVTRRIVRPLRDLTSTLEQLEQGDFTARAGDSPISEVSRVQTGVNSMALSLSNAQRDLEEQVEQATHQLVETVKDLERSESEYRNIVDNASDIVFTLNDQLQLLQTNPAMETLTGRSHLELVGEYFTALLQHDQRTRIEQLYSHQLVALAPMTYETVIETPAGELITLEISSRAQMQDDKCIGFHGVARDITARQRAEQARSEAQQLAETANNAKSVFLASVSHEIRSPMNGILGFLDLLNKTSLSETQSDYISTAQRSAANLMRIVDDLLEIQRREAGYHDFRPEPVDLNAFLEHIVAESAQNTDSENLEIVTAFDPALPGTVLTDPARLNQVLTNIIGNACKFTEAGSVFFSVDCIDSADTSATLVFSIRDSGPGFSQEHLDEVLEPFGRSPDAIDNKVAGVGLGLAIAKSLVDGMAGRLTVGNHPAGGAEVTVTLSLLTATDTNSSTDETVAGASVPQQVRTSQTSEIEGTLKALVVDDSEINTRFVTTLLGYYGVLTHAANSGAKAVQLCETTQFDLVIMDLHMPEMNGIETANRIGNLVGEQCPPIIALTADATADSARNLLQSGFDGVLFKPASESDLISTIARCTGHNFETSERPQPLVEAQSIEHSSVLNQRRGLELAGGDMDLWETNVRLFVKDLRSNLALFERPSTDVDRAQLESYCHRVTGSAAYIGANDIESTALAIDRDCKSLSVSELEKRCGLFLAAADEFLNLAERSGWLDETARPSRSA